MTDSAHPSTFALPPGIAGLIGERLALLYGPSGGAATFGRLSERLARFAASDPLPGAARGNRLPLGAADAMLITYGDQIQEPGRPPLQALHEWLTAHLQGAISSVHILPFYPFSSDDGFSVIDYTAVDPALGTWDDISRLGREARLMFDAVINHISAHSAWFAGYLRDEPRYRDYFIVLDQPVDLSGVTRPRTHPVLTTFATPTGAHRVWTTFSVDQIDLNFRNPDVLLAMIDVLLLYVARGAAYLRLDAIGYLWKQPGTTCIHLPETHAIVQLIRGVLDAVAPRVLLITETNVPHADNISYFGDGTNEAQLVYQFPLAPLVLNAFHTGSARHLQQWAASLAPPSPATTFFNFLASHDGIGVMPAVGILSPGEIDDLARTTLRHGGRVSYKTNSDGTQSPYELNITLFDALSDPATADEETAIARFMAAQAIMLALAGLPGIYVHSLVGSSNDLDGLARTGRARSINRQKWQRGAIDARLADAGSRARRVLTRYLHLLRQRARSSAFDPAGKQLVLRDTDMLFVLIRTAPDGSDVVCCVQNVANASQTLTLRPGDWLDRRADALHDLVSGMLCPVDDAGVARITVAPYAVLWLQAR